LLVFPLTDGNTRIAIEAGTIEPGEDLSKTLQDLTVERLEELVCECIAPSKFKVTETAWLTLFKINERRAEHFVYKNRVFLAGDSAHVHSPAGGQGLNTGLQDAHNLAWKLAFVLNKVAPESILETYEEREAMADRAIAVSSKLLQRNRDNGFVNMLFRRIFYAISPVLIAVMKYFSYATEVNMVGLLCK
jgi:2-polyprenyl-6-methoxyphenol hydroxylase-like FAD-dependent oxidoreductase